MMVKGAALHSHLHRLTGIGDVLMALPACKAIKHFSDHEVVFITIDACRELVRACPYVDQVVTTTEELRKLASEHLLDFQQGRFWNLQQTSFGTAGCHQVDAYWAFIGIQGGNDLKDIELRVPEESRGKVDRLLSAHPLQARKLALLHPAVGDPNRTWPAEAWMELSKKLMDQGFAVVLVGSNTADPYRGAGKLELDGVIDLIDRLDPLDFVALCHRAHLLVSTDGGPIQLAGATDIGIVGIYSVAKGAWRLPYRHGQAAWNAIPVEPDCPHFPCLPPSLNPSLWKTQADRLGLSPDDTPEIMSRWCLEQRQYHCMAGGLRDVERVFQACLKLLGQS